MNLYNHKEFRHSLLEKKNTGEESKNPIEKGSALPDGSFPIENENDLNNAILAINRAKDKEVAKKHIIKRAKALNIERVIPGSWLNESISNEDLQSRISDVIHNELELRDVPYSESNDVEISPDSIDNAAAAVINLLRENSIINENVDQDYVSVNKNNFLAYKKGREAFDNNKKLNENPFDKNTYLHDNWNIGWTSAQYDNSHTMNENSEETTKIVLQIYPNGSKSNSYVEIDNNRKIVNVFFDPKEPHLYHESLEVGNTLDPDFESDEVSE